MSAELVARDEDDGDILVELPGAHLALGIVDLVDALLLVLDAFGSLQPRSASAAVTLAMSASEILSSSSSLARAKAVHSKAMAIARAMVFVVNRSPVFELG